MTPEPINRAIEKAKQELQQMIDLNPQTMAMVDGACRVQRANRSLLSLLSLSDFGQVIGRGLSELFPSEDDEFFCSLLNGGEGFYDRETTVELADEGKRMLKFTVVGVSQAGDHAGIIIEDVTGEKEQARAEEKEHKKEALEEVVGGLMHNLNQPLTVIMMRAQLMSVAIEGGKATDEELQESLHDILRLTSWVADTIRYIKEPDDYVTEPYVGDINILDLKESGKTDRDRTRAERLETLLLVLDAHLPGASIHAQRCGAYAELIAREMGLDDDAAGEVKRSAMLHDIGKIGTPDELLMRPAALTDEEMVVVRKHAEKGYHLLIRTSFPQEAEAVYAHHERYDGQGYPRGLSGDDILLAARITAVVDAFEVLRFGRPYQDARSLPETIARIKEASGKQFDPAVVDAFLACAEKLDALEDISEPS